MPEARLKKLRCAGCAACCRREMLALFPEHGDDPAAYQTNPVPQVHPASGRTFTVLAQQPNGDCVYLGKTPAGEDGCTIHDRRPWACRQFDCRVMVRGFGDALDQAVAVSRGALSLDVFNAARARGA